jgi:hypothetical protein|tara:strand:- start:118 stop:318 length:201 start_codon:yes stop_codon:yes gene_type:complete
MPNSKKRGGAKAHKKRVQKRNNTINSDMNRLRNAFQKEMSEEIKKMEEQKTEIVEVEDTDTEAQTA